MSSNCEDRIHRLLLTLSVHASHLDLTQIKNFLCDLADQAEADERKRVLTLLEGTERRIYNSKGRNYKMELDLLQSEIYRGQSVMDTVV